MFRERIDRTPFTTEEADYQFPRIKYGNTPFAGDMSMLATLRAMFGERVGDDGEITVVYRNYELSKSDSERSTDAIVTESALGAVSGLANQLTIVEVVNQETSGRVMKSVKDCFCESTPGWESIEKVNAFFLKAFPVQCYVNRELRSAILLTDRLTLRKWHYIQVAVFHCFPWFFLEKPLGEVDKKLVYSLSEETATVYLSLLSDLASRYDFERIRIDRLLSNFETSFETQRLASFENELASKRHEIESFDERIARLLADIREINYKLIGLKEVIDEHAGNSLIRDYFLADRKLGLEDSRNGSLSFTVKGFIENFNEDEVEARLGNAYSFVYDTYSDARINGEAMKRLLTAIFIDRDIKLRACAAYVFNTGDSSISVRAQQDKRYPAEFDTYMPNPHIQNYGCMGTYKRIINERLRDGDYVGALVQCEVSCNSLNWTDQTVMKEFMRFMYNSTNACFELPDGRCVDQVDAVAWLKEKE